jgi:hypothetical protein
VFFPTRAGHSFYKTTERRIISGKNSTPLENIFGDCIGLKQACDGYAVLVIAIIRKFIKTCFSSSKRRGETQRSQETTFRATIFPNIQVICTNQSYSKSAEFDDI